MIMSSWRVELHSSDSFIDVLVAQVNQHKGKTIEKA